MRPLRYSINVTLDGCVDHRAGEPDEELHEHHEANIARADALLYGRTTYQMMEEAWRTDESGAFADWIPDELLPFARTIDAAQKYVVSNTLEDVDWNAELLRGDLESEVRRLKDLPGEGLATGGVTLPLALADLGLIDEYEFVVHPVVAGHGPNLLDGLREPLRLHLTERFALGSGAVVLRYVPREPRG